MLKAVGRELVIGLRIGVYAAWRDLRRSVARNGLGPLWSTLGLVLTAALVGRFFNGLAQVNLPPYEIYLPSVVLGMIVWSFLAGATNAAAAGSLARMGRVRFDGTPILGIAARPLFGRGLTFFINVVCVFLAGVMLLDDFRVDALGLLLGFCLLVLNAAWFTVWAAIAAARFRDTPQLISWGFNLGFFLSPILWVPENLGLNQWLLLLNPIAILTECVRGPLLHGVLPVESALGAFALLLTGASATIIALRYARPRLPYWA